jgi:four helix bundle protein
MGRFKDRSLMERVFNFVIKVLRLLEKLPKNRRNMIIEDQLTKSATSTGANLEEADGAISRREFVKFVNITKREMKESNYWLRILRVFESNLVADIEPLIDESEELTKIFSSILKKSSEN